MGFFGGDGWEEGSDSGGGNIFLFKLTISEKSKLVFLFLKISFYECK